jgi:thiamine kinase-like enzyme
LKDVASTDHLTPEAIISRIDEWKHKEIRCEALGGGITNHNFLISVGGDPAHPGGAKYVLRIPGEGTDMFIDRSNERVCSIAAAEAGVAPPVVYAVGDALVTAFIDAETMHPDTLAGRPDRIRQVVETVKRVHQRATFPNEIDLFDMIRHYTSMAREAGAPFPDDIDWMFAIEDQIEAAMARDKPAPAACHNDLLSENFLIDKDGRMWLIDWEYGGMTDPYFDLGDFCVEHPFSAQEEQLILTAYCGEMVEHRYYRMLLHKLTADLWWSIWAMIQSKLSTIDFDFYEYGVNRVRRFRTNAGHPDYQRWIAGV